MIEINQIYNEDCLDLMSKLPNNCVDLILTDPPYELDSHGGGQNADLHRKLSDKHIDFISNGFDFKILDECCRVLKKMNFAVFCSNKQISKLMTYFENLKLSTTLLMWHKTNPVPFGNGKFLSDVEFIVRAFEKGCPFNQDGKNISKVFTYPSPNAKDRIHPAQKPYLLIGDLIKLFSNENNLIFDPFSGSGTTAKAAIQLNRNYIASEINQDLFDASEKWLKPFTHQKGLF